MALSCRKENIDIITQKNPSNHKGDFFYLNCPNSSRTEKLKIHDKICKNKDFCGVEMPSEKNIKI